MASGEQRPHALASRDLYTDGAEVLWDFAQHTGPGSPDDRVVKHLIVPRSGQYVFKDIVQHYFCGRSVSTMTSSRGRFACRSSGTPTWFWTRIAGTANLSSMGVAPALRTLWVHFVLAKHSRQLRLTMASP